MKDLGLLFQENRLTGRLYATPMQSTMYHVCPRHLDLAQCEFALRIATVGRMSRGPRGGLNAQGLETYQDAHPASDIPQCELISWETSLQCRPFGLS